MGFSGSGGGIIPQKEKNNSKQGKVLKILFLKTLE